MKIILVWCAIAFVWLTGYLFGFAKGYNKGVLDERQGYLGNSEE